MSESNSEFPCTIELRFTREEYKTLMDFIDLENPAKPLLTTHPDAGLSFLEKVLLEVCNGALKVKKAQETRKLKEEENLVEWREFREWRKARKAAE